jgi:hypothetical protein
MNSSKNRKGSFILLFLINSFYMLEAQDQKGYHLFKPTPRANMREFSIDRPDVTESPISVDPGHFQFEGDMVKWSKDNHGKSERTINFVNGLYKMGLTHSWDIHIGIELHNLYQDEEANTVDRGYGSTTIRLKHNFWGNDGNTSTALGIIPYVTFLSGNPLDSDVAYGVGFPFSYDFSDNMGLGAQAQFDFIPTSEGNTEMSFFQTVVVGGKLAGNMDFYFEGLATFPKGTALFSVNGGLIYNVTPNVKIDIATNQGINREAPTRVYLGLSFRI